MTERVQKQKPASKRDDTIEETPKPKDAAALKAELDALLDEVDEVLEEGAEEMARTYTQKGGQAVRLSERMRRLLSPWPGVRTA